MYALLALGAVGVVLWGLRDQQRLAINVGVLGFALAVLGFYFSSLYDKLGRALGLIGIGVLFIGGGWLLERARRRLIARLQAGAAMTPLAKGLARRRGAGPAGRGHRREVPLRPRELSAALGRDRALRSRTCRSAAAT